MNIEKSDFFRMSVIENYVKKLPKIKIKTFDNKNGYKYSFRKKFPKLGNLEHFIIEEICSLCGNFSNNAFGSQVHGFS